MVQFRKMKASTFTAEGFKSKKEAISYLAEKGMTGHKFENPTDVMVYLRQNPLPGAVPSSPAAEVEEPETKEPETKEPKKAKEPKTPKPSKKAKEPKTPKKAKDPKTPEKAKKAKKTPKAPKKSKKEEYKLEILPEDVSGDESPAPLSDSEC